MLHFAFNSIKDAFMIFSAIPLSAVGGVLFLGLRGLPFSISAGVGFIALFGIAVLNGIVLIEHLKSLKEQGIENKFIGKNFVFDQRRAEKISDDVIASCHQCGAPADIHVNCANDACHLLFIQCDSCKETMENCCSTNCMEINRLPPEEQKLLRKGQGNSNDIFKKGRAGHLHYSKNLRNIHDSQPEI